MAEVEDGVFLGQLVDSVHVGSGEDPLGDSFQDRMVFLLGIHLGEGGFLEKLPVMGNPESPRIGWPKPPGHSSLRKSQITNRLELSSRDLNGCFAFRRRGFQSLARVKTDEVPSRVSPRTKIFLLGVRALFGVLTAIRITGALPTVDPVALRGATGDEESG